MYQKSKAKQIISNPEDITRIVQNTIYDMANICAQTLGPGGRPVIIERCDMPPLITKDGVTVAKAIGVSDSAANLIIDAAKEICLNTAKEAGDGTTTAIVLASAIVAEGQRYLQENPKCNPQKFARELNKAYEEVLVPMLKEVAIPVDTEEQLLDVATISANGDVEIATAAVQAVMAAGNDGTVMIEEGQGRDMRVETLDGYVITTGLKEHGQVGPVFINDRANQQVKVEATNIVLYDGSLNDLKVPGIIQEVIAPSGEYDGTPLAVIAHGFSDLVLEKFAKITKKGSIILPIKTPRSGLPNGASMFLHDMAAYTGATVYDPGNVEGMTAEGIGDCDSLRMNMYETFITCNTPREAVTTRIEELKAIEKTAFSEYDKAFIRAAVAKLTGGISTIWVGGVSDLEVREKKMRVEDAVEAVRSAIAEGVIPGGCWSHIAFAKAMARARKYQSWVVLEVALITPLARLLDNCGADFEEIFPTMHRQSSQQTVFDANNHEFVDPFVAGIIEPAKVCRVSISNAISVAALLITLGGIVVVPRDSDLERQMELADSAFKNMMETANEG